MNYTILSHILYTVIFALAYIAEQKGYLPVGGANTIIALLFGTTVAHNIYTSVANKTTPPTTMTNPVTPDAVSSPVTITTPTRG